MAGAAPSLPPRSLVGPETIDALVARAKLTPAGCFLEVGVYQGGTAWHLAQVAKEQHRSIYLYDTFWGIPFKDRIDSHEIGDFQDTDVMEVRRAIPYARVIQGVFPHSAVLMEPVAFAHLDCDQYHSYATSLLYLESRMVPGGVIWCDDAPVLAGAAQAVSEFAARKGPRVRLATEAGHTVIHF